MYNIRSNANPILQDAHKVKEFSDMWNKSYRKGAVKKIAKHFNISECNVYRIRIKLELENLMSPEHPGRKKLFRYIRDRYFKDQYSTTKISNSGKYKISVESVRKILMQQGMKLRSSDCNNSLYFSVRSGKMTSTLVKAIKKDYSWNNMTIKDLAIKYSMSYEAMSNKLKQMKIKREYGKRCECGEKCQWCGKVMEFVNISRGSRKQKYCSSTCKHRAVDYRRHLKGVKISEVSYKIKDDFLRDTWGNNYESQREKIINVKPIRKLGGEQC